MATPVTPLRQRMLEDMKIRNMAAGTRRDLCARGRELQRYHGRSPDSEDVRDYQLHLWSPAALGAYHFDGIGC